MPSDSIFSRIQRRVASERPDPPREPWLRLPRSSTIDVGVKPPVYLPLYERLLGELRDRPLTLLELGVWKGHSLEMWRDAFPRATIVGIDLKPPAMDLGPRVHIVRGDQTDAELLGRVRAEQAPGGFDVIIDDASHIGVTTARSLQALFNTHLRAGGLYVVEDWGTGYLTDWHDGGPLAGRLGVAGLDASTAALSSGEPSPVPMPSHDLGLVGVAKRLLDHVAAGTVRHAQPDAVDEVLEIESLTVWDGLLALRKRAA